MVKNYKNKFELKWKLDIYCSNVIRHIDRKLKTVQIPANDIIQDTYKFLIANIRGKNVFITFDPIKCKLSYVYNTGNLHKVSFKIFEAVKYGETHSNNILEMCNFGVSKNFIKNIHPDVRMPRKLDYSKKAFKYFIKILNTYIDKYKIPYILLEPFIINDDCDDNEIVKIRNLTLLRKFGTKDIKYTNYADYIDTIDFCEYLEHPFYPVVYFEKPKPIFYTIINETFECPISMMEVNEGFITICNHKFGKENLINWLEVDTKKSCPLCRTKLHE
jgi:hypothetical protein